VVVSQETVQRTDDPEVWFDPLGAVELKRVAEPLPLYQAHRRSSGVEPQMPSHKARSS
jgi:class 3 adenylate cyclase